MVKVRKYKRKDGTEVHQHSRSKANPGLKFSPEELKNTNFQDSLDQKVKNPSFADLAKKAKEINSKRKSTGDNQNSNKNTYKLSKDGVDRWAKNPGKSDLEGIDTPVQEKKEEPKKVEKPKEEPKKTTGRRTEQFQDIGEKFGGAKKDIYATNRILSWDDVNQLEENTADALQYIIKSKVVPPINDEAELSRGVSVGAIYMKKLAYKYLLSKPKINSKGARAFYFNEATDVFDALQQVMTANEFATFQNEWGRQLWTRKIDREQYKDRMGNKFYAIITRTTRGSALKLTEAVQMDINNTSIEEANKLLERQKSKGTIKSKIYKKPYLEFIEREGGRQIRKTDPERIIKELGLRGVEYGNWVNDDEAKKNVKYFIGSMYDLEQVTGLPVTKMNKLGKLGIAFGSRGSGSASAHFEPYRNVINLTKKNGDGSLAHEWGHYLDHIMKKQYGDPEDNVGKSAVMLTSETKEPKNIVQQKFKKVMDAINEGDAIDIQEVAKPTGWSSAYSFDARYRKSIQQGKTNQDVFNEYYERSKRRYESQLQTINKFYSDEKRRTKEIIKAERKLKSETKKIAQAVVSSSGKDSLKFEIPTGKSEYVLRSSRQGTRGGYWTEPHELFARAFESYVQDNVKAKNLKNNYLASGTTPGMSNQDDFPYPQGSERRKINKVMGELIETISDQLSESPKQSLKIPETEIEKILKMSFEKEIKKSANGGWDWQIRNKITGDISSSGWTRERSSATEQSNQALYRLQRA